MITKKVLVAVNDEITAIQVNNRLNLHGLWELEFVHLMPEVIDEILEWKPDLVIFDTNLLPGLNGTDYFRVFQENNIPFLCLTTDLTALSDSLSSDKVYTFSELEDAVNEALSLTPVFAR